ncbi:anthranilate synthase component I [Epidermidibacterium keratini]|uniref:Anthranilate synthase component 1 n=1 Tax=Epidermidibacterium keratini TaxID=1891644 RepID=A0A7L4YJX6_9ACTN|nr:anthranilate synthase component I [Epidermidibacterium keratini]QHB99108.1 anthranilate synthase component I [Epidermidibacterium keratini]
MSAPIGAVSPSREQFAARVQTHRVIPVTRTLLADGETPVGVYRKLAGGVGTFLLESAERGHSWSRYSFVGVRASATLTESGGRAKWSGTPPTGVPTEGDVLDVLAQSWRAIRSPRDPGLPALAGGLVGYLGYDVATLLEPVGDRADDDLQIPMLSMLLVSDLAVVDHHDGTVMLVATEFVDANMSAEQIDAAYDDALRRLDSMTADLAGPLPTLVQEESDEPDRPVRSRTPEGDYRPAVERALEHVRDGDVFQVQISQRFAVDTDAEALDVYRILRLLNPSPYMYLLRVDGFDIVGCSPEALVTVEDGEAVLHPIAGTRKRGDTPERDQALADELVSDPKERAEHVMLVDLARNDLGRVCAPGTVRVTELGAVEKYSHVWHIVSTVTGTVADDKDAFDVLLSCFPAGTLTGAPKVRAMQVIDELEPVRRGIYGGAVGYLSAAGDLDMAICIRTALMKDGTAYVQSAGGVVADSQPHLEELETQNKAKAALTAVQTAQRLRPVGRLEENADG